MRLLTICCILIFTAGLKAQCDTAIFIPTAFDLRTMTDSTRFMPTSSWNVPTQYSFTIYDRFGEKLFETDIPQQGWNGTYRNRGHNVTNGTYMWMMSYSYSGDTSAHCSGFVTIVNADAKVHVIALDTISCKPELLVPNAWTPNDDGINDIFIPRFGCLPVEYEMQMYDRWGNQIFVSTDARVGWNGNINGHPAEMGVYVWKIKCRFYEGDKLHQMIGDVALVR